MEGRIVGYTIVSITVNSGSNRYAGCRDVVDAIENGWELYGDPLIASKFIIHQVMVKREQPKPTKAVAEHTVLPVEPSDEHMARLCALVDRMGWNTALFGPGDMRLIYDAIVSGEWRGNRLIDMDALDSEGGGA